MFEDIHFYHLSSSGIINLPGGELNPVSENGRWLSGDSDVMKNIGNFTSKDTSYSLAGTSRFIVCADPSPEIADNLIYLQAFAWMCSEEGYYTERKGFYDSYLMCYTLNGLGELSYEGKTYSLKPGTIFMIDCRKVHRYAASAGIWEHLDTHLYGGNIDFYYEYFVKNGLTAVNLTSLSDREIFIGLLHETLLDGRDGDCPGLMRAHGKYEQILNLLLNAPEEEKRIRNRTPEYVVEACEFLKKNFRSDIRLDDLSDIFCVSKYHFCREYKRYYGISPKMHVTKLRISEAKNLLTGTEIPCSVAGSLAGIPNEANFIKLFEKYVGMTPGEYRIRTRGK